MALTNEFSVPATLEQVLEALSDVPRAAACVPGAKLSEANAGSARGDLRITLGQTSITYRGEMRMEEVDRSAGSLRLTVVAQQARGAGAVQGTVDVRLRNSGGATVVSTRSELTVTGRAAELPKGTLEGAARSLAERFGRALTGLITENGAAPATAADSVPESTPQVTISAASEQEEQTVPGVVRIVTDEPAYIGPPTAWSRLRDAAEDVMRERPWLVPSASAVVAVVTLAVVAGRRRR